MFFISLPQFGTHCYSCLNKVPIRLGNGRKCFPTGKAHIRSLLPLASRNQAISKRGQEARPQQHLQQVLIERKFSFSVSNLEMECPQRGCREQGGISTSVLNGGDLRLTEEIQMGLWEKLARQIGNPRPGHPPLHHSAMSCMLSCFSHV